MVIFGAMAAVKLGPDTLPSRLVQPWKWNWNAQLVSLPEIPQVNAAAELHPFTRHSVAA